MEKWKTTAILMSSGSECHQGSNVDRKLGSSEVQEGLGHDDCRVKSILGYLKVPIHRLGLAGSAQAVHKAYGDNTTVGASGESLPSRQCFVAPCSHWKPWRVSRCHMSCLQSSLDMIDSNL